jgi:hypothetical protein
MNDFNAFLMPFSFLRRWSYNELIPALLYFDRVTFLMDDIEPQYISDKYKQPDTPPVRLRSPEELKGLKASDFVDGLTVEQHQYYWPMRDLMKEEVIVISSTGLGPIIGAPEPRQQLQTLLDQKNKMALEYESYASLFYDAYPPAYMPIEQHDLTSFDKAMHVYSWIDQALRWRPGWQRVTLHPHAYRALLSALDVFPDLHQLFLKCEVDRSGRASQPPAQSYLAMRVVGTLLEERLKSFTLEVDDPNALSEILEVRQKYAADLQAFRAKMAEATNEWELQDTDLKYMPGKIESYIQTVSPEFERTRRALSDKQKIHKFLRTGGALIVIGACAGIGTAVGTALAGPAGTAAGATVGAGLGTAASEALKSFFAELGRETADKVKSKDVSIDKSVLYLFRAEKALQR